MDGNGRETWLFQQDSAAGAVLVKWWLFPSPFSSVPSQGRGNSLFYGVIPIPWRAVYFGSGIGFRIYTFKKNSYSFKPVASNLPDVNGLCLLLLTHLPNSVLPFFQMISQNVK